MSDFKGIKAKLLKFFDKGNVQNSGRSPKELSTFSYWDRVLELCSEYPDSKSIVVEFRHIAVFDMELATELINNPDVWLEAASEAVETISSEKIAITSKSLKGVAVRIVGLPDVYEVPISKLRKHHLGKFVSVRCTVSKATKVEPAYEECAFKCMRCGHVTVVPQSKDTDILQEPFAGCENDTCGKKGPFKRDDNQSKFYDHQYMKVQEPLESLRGRQPEYLYVSCADDIAGAYQPGDKVIISGVLKGRLKMKQNGTTRFNELFLIANSITKSDRDFENLVITPEEEKKIKELSALEDIDEIIYASIAPSVYGMVHVKSGLALQLFSGVRTYSKDGTTTRGDIHVLLIGDPGIAKSQMLKYVSVFAPRAIMVSAATGGGLTGVAVHDEFDGKWAIEGGAMTIVSGSDKIEGGICCIDEMDKMNEKDRSSIHSALEQQSVDIAKAGLFAHLPTICGCLGAANPKYGRYNPYESIASQFNLADTLLSRFDLLFVLRDIVDEDADYRLAVHVLSGKKSEPEKPILDSEFLRKYIAYAKIHHKPEMTPEAIKYITTFYVKTRTAGSKVRDSVPITVRSLESAKRLATAHAKMRLSDKVELVDAKKVCSILLDNLNQVGIDPDTGALDASVIFSGTSGSQRKKISDLKTAISKLSKADLIHQAAHVDDVKRVCSTKGLTETEVDNLLSKMKQKGDVFFPSQKHIKLVVPFEAE